jgi:uncharacterized protein (DUF362 family)
MDTAPVAETRADPVTTLRGKVAVLKTSPATVVEDFGRLMELARFREALPREHDTILKINISWHHYYPACSTTPWQLEGVTKKLLEDGRPAHTLIPAQNRTVVVDPKVGAVRNRLDVVIHKYGLEFIYLYEPHVEWITYHPHCEMTALPDIFPEGIQIPRLMIGRNALHLPTMKTHVFTTTTGAMKNAFGGLLNEKRHWTHSRIHETLVDLLALQQEIHPGLFAVMDGTISGTGPGPRAMQPVVTNFILAAADQVAIDALAAKMMGFDPMGLDYLRLAHERGLGVADPKEIEIIGEDVSGVNLGFTVGDTFASRGQKSIYHGKLKSLENMLLRSPIVPWSYLASRAYHDAYWFPCIGQKRVAEIMRTDWGELFRSYSHLPHDEGGSG